MKFGEKHKDAKLTNHDVKMLRILRSKGASYKDLASLYGIGYSTAWDAINYVTWKHIR